MLKRFLAYVIASAGLSPVVVGAQAAQAKTILKPVPVLVRVPNGFPIPARTNGASRRKKTNRLHLSKATRRKHQ